MFILKKGHQPGVYVPLRALFLVVFPYAKNRFSHDEAQISCCDLVFQPSEDSDQPGHLRSLIRSVTES